MKYFVLPSQKINSQRGFTLVEMLLGMVAASIIALASVILIRVTLENTSFVMDRKEVLSNVRYALNRVSQELVKLKSTDLVSISPSSITYIDSANIQTSFNLYGDGFPYTFRRGEDMLAKNIVGATFTYYDANGSEIADMTQVSLVRRIRLDISARPKNRSGDLSASMEVYPRNFYYTNFQ